MQAHPTLIKRPVLDVDGRITVGFKPEIYEQAVSAQALTGTEGPRQRKVRTGCRTRSCPTSAPNCGVLSASSSSQLLNAVTLRLGFFAAEVAT